MKIGDPPKTTRVHRPDGVRKKNAPGEAVKVSATDEITLLGIPDSEMTPRVREALISLLEDVRALRAELDHSRERIAELETLADRDPMLEMLNRRAFARELDRVLAMIDRYNVRASLIIIDLNDLKIINDTRGHAAGDAALSHVATHLSANVRQTDVVARLGGDEFAILLLQADQAVAVTKARIVADLIAGEAVQWEGEAFAASISWGAVEIRKGVSAREALNLADEAMYEAKKMK